VTVIADLLSRMLRSAALPFAVLALVAPSVIAFAALGPQFGLAIGAATVGAVLVIAARARHDERIEVASSADGRYRLLVVTTEPLEDPPVVEEIAQLAGRGHGPGTEPAEIRVLAPAQSSRLDRWASDLDAARAAAQRVVAVSLGSLAAADVDAAGRVGDGDTVQAIEDELREFAAAEVVIVEGPQIDDAAVGELRRRLDRPVTELDPRAIRRADSQRSAS
jgi:hypothetical protein